jgi:predicted secreted protein
MTSGISGFGSNLNWDTVDIAELTNISGPSQSADTIDLTSHDSSDAYREFVAGLRDGGEISFEGNLITTDSTGQIAMHTDFQAGSTKAWSITFPSSLGSMAGNGIVTAFELSYPAEGKISISGTIKVTGKPTLTIS